MDTAPPARDYAAEAAQLRRERDALAAAQNLGRHEYRGGPFGLCTVELVYREGDVRDCSRRPNASIHRTALVVLAEAGEGQPPAEEDE